MNTSPVILTIKNLSYTIDDRIILSQVSIDVAQGSRIIITGHNGSGKSTLLKLIHKGHPHIIKNEHSVMLHQNINDNLFCDLTVLENFQLLGIKNVAIVEELLARFKSHPSLHTCVARLSGVEHQRLAFYMRLLMRPDLLLLDEFTSALDRKTSHVLMQEMLALTKQHGITAIIITHDTQLIEDPTCKHFEMDSGRLRLPKQG